MNIVLHHIFYTSDHLLINSWLFHHQHSWSPFYPHFLSEYHYPHLFSQVLYPWYFYTRNNNPKTCASLLSSFKHSKIQGKKKFENLFLFFRKMIILTILSGCITPFRLLLSSFSLSFYLSLFVISIFSLLVFLSHLERTGEREIIFEFLFVPCMMFKLMMVAILVNHDGSSSFKLS